MKSAIEQEMDRAAAYVETTLENLAETIKKIVADGLSYDVVIFKDGIQVHQMPAGLATVLTAVGMLPPVRLLALIGTLGATYAGYTFRVTKKPIIPKK